MAATPAWYRPPPRWSFDKTQTAAPWFWEYDVRFALYGRGGAVDGWWDLVKRKNLSTFSNGDVGWTPQFGHSLGGNTGGVRNPYFSDSAGAYDITGSITAICFITMTSVNQGDVLFGNWRNTNPYYGHLFSVRNGGDLRFFAAEGSADTVLRDSTGGGFWTSGDTVVVAVRHNPFTGDGRFFGDQRPEGEDFDTTYPRSPAGNGNGMTICGEANGQSTNTMNAQMHACYWIAGELSDDEIRTILDDPWLPLRPWWSVKKNPAALKASAGGGPVTLTTQGADHAVTFDNVDITQASTLVVSESAHATTFDNVDLVQNTPLTTQGADHAVTFDNVDVVQQHQLEVSESTHATTFDTPALTQQHQLTTQGADHAVTFDNVVLVTGIQLDVSESTHATTFDTPSLTQASTLVSNEAAPQGEMEVDAVLETQGADHATLFQRVTFPGGNLVNKLISRTRVYLGLGI